jgi:hypothetical protein
MMTQLLTHGSTQRTVVLVCIALALLVLPLAGTLHCEAAHAAEHARVPLAETCCVFLCLTGLIGVLMIQSKWLSIMHVTFDLKPVRLANHLARWVPPPRSIGLLP